MDCESWTIEKVIFLSFFSGESSFVGNQKVHSQGAIFFFFRNDGVETGTIWETNYVGVHLLCKIFDLVE